MMVDNLTGWVLDHFSVEEIKALSDALSNPKIEFMSDAGADAAAGVLKALQP